MNEVVLSFEELATLATDLMVAIGCDEDIATCIADHVVGSDLRGVHSHGTMPFVQYVEQATTAGNTAFNLLL